MVPAAQVAVLERRNGIRIGIEAIQAAGEAMLPLARKGWLDPRHSDIVQQRSVVHTTPCPSMGCTGCSRCVRAAAVAKNRERYGCDDYMGTRAWRSDISAVAS
jgi:hypothetical protein